MTAVRILTLSLTVFTLLSWHSVASRMSPTSPKEAGLNVLIKNLQKCPNAGGKIQQICASSQFSCRNRCGTSVQPEEELPDLAYCACDSKCSVYNDCCWDYADECNEIFTSLSHYRLKGVQTECINGNRLFSGCQDNGSLEGETEILQEPVVSLPLDDRSSFDFKNVSVYECNSEYIDNDSLVRWGKRFMGLWNPNALDMIKKYINNDEMRHTYLSMVISDLPPQSITPRRCVRNVRIGCNLAACSFDDSFESSYDTCRYIMGRRFSDSSFNSTIDLVDLSTVIFVDKNNTDTSKQHDDNSEKSFNSTLKERKTDGATTRQDVEELNTTTPACTIRVQSFSDSFWASKHNFEVDVSYDQSGNLRIISSSSDLWKEAYCAEEPKTKCEISLKCGKGKTLSSEGSCLEPKALSLEVKAPTSVNLGLQNVLNKFSKLLPSLSPDKYLSRSLGSFMTVDYIALIMKEKKRRLLKSYPFNDDELSFPHLWMARTLVERFEENQENQAQSLPKSFSSSNVTFCLYFDTSFTESKCNELVTNGVVNKFNNEPLPDLVSIYSSNNINSSNTSPQASPTFNNLTHSAAAKLQALKLINGLVLSLSVSLLLIRLG